MGESVCEEDGPPSGDANDPADNIASEGMVERMLPEDSNLVELPTSISGGEQSDCAATIVNGDRKSETTQGTVMKAAQAYVQACMRSRKSTSLIRGNSIRVDAVDGGDEGSRVDVNVKLFNDSTRRSITRNTSILSDSIGINGATTLTTATEPQDFEKPIISVDNTKDNTKDENTAEVTAGTTSLLKSPENDVDTEAEDVVETATTAITTDEAIEAQELLSPNNSSYSKASSVASPSSSSPEVIPSTNNNDTVLETEQQIILDEIPSDTKLITVEPVEEATADSVVKSVADKAVIKTRSAVASPAVSSGQNSVYLGDTLLMVATDSEDVEDEVEPIVTKPDEGNLSNTNLENTTVYVDAQDCSANNDCSNKSVKDSLEGELTVAKESVSTDESGVPQIADPAAAVDENRQNAGSS